MKGKKGINWITLDNLLVNHSVVSLVDYLRILNSSKPNNMIVKKKTYSNSRYYSLSL